MFRRRHRDRDTREEFDTHIAMEIERQIANGLPPREAAEAARRKFGNALRHREEMQELRGGLLFARLWIDLRHAVRSLAHRPFATGAAALALALGMGGPTAVLMVLANFSTAVFAQVHDPDALVLITETPPLRPRDRQPATNSTWKVWQPHLAEHAAAISLAQPPLRLSLSWAELPEPVVVQPISTTLLPLLGVRIQSGRGFVDSDAAAGAPPVVIISDTFWWTRFGASDDAIGQVITIDSTRRTIVGVMPRAFWVTTRDVDMWVPVATDSPPDGRFFVVTRLRAGDSSEALAKRLDVLAPQVAAANPGREPGWNVHVAWLGPRSLLNDLLEQPGILMVVAAGVLALIVACANVAMLMVARGAARQKETAIRSAVGASRARLIRQFLIESTLVSMAGGTLTLLVVYAVLRLVVSNTEELASAIGAFRMDWRVMAGVLGVAALVGALAGAAPAVSDSQVNVMAALKETGFFGWPVGRQRLRRSLLILEVALTVMLLAVVALLMRGVADLEHIPPGFNPDRLLRVTLDRTQHLEGPATAPPPFTTTLHRVRAVPGVESAATVLEFPPGIGVRRRIVPADEARSGTAAGQQVYVNAVSDEYFRTLGLSVFAGRPFGEYDAGGTNVAIVSQALARRHWPGAVPVGQSIRLEGEPTARLVIGVVSDQLLDEGRRVPAAIVFIPFADGDARRRLSSAESLLLLVRISARSSEVVTAIRKAMAEDNPLQTVRVSSVTDVLAIAAAETRVGAVLVSPFMVLTLLLTISGVYGLLAQNVAQRAHELAVRVTLGASRTDLFAFVVRDGLALSAAGGALGIAGALAVDRSLNAFLLGVPGDQPVVLAGAAAVMMLATVIAALVPYRRAVRIDPGRTLRYE